MVVKNHCDRVKINIYLRLIFTTGYNSKNKSTTQIPYFCDLVFSCCIYIFAMDSSQKTDDQIRYTYSYSTNSIRGRVHLDDNNTCTDISTEKKMIKFKTKT